MRLQNVVFILIGMFFIALGPAAGASAEVCATNYDQLALTSRLQALQPYFVKNGVTGYVNETNGSYFELNTREALILTFMTSGLFDRSLIKHSGSVHFCDDGTSVSVIGLNRGDKIVVANGVIQLGGGGPRKTFRIGPKPDLLRRLDGR